MPITTEADTIKKYLQLKNWLTTKKYKETNGKSRMNISHGYYLYISKFF